MNTYKLTLLKGDGIGPEIVREAVKVLMPRQPGMGLPCPIPMP